MSNQKDTDLLNDTQNQVPSIGRELISLIQPFSQARNKKFVVLLVGRTGVGKSSTVNSLMGQQIAPVGKYDPTTMEVESFDCEINGIKFTIVDTPGLCDDLPEKENDRKYIELILSKVKQVDSLWFVTRLDDPRVTSDEMRGIKIISEAFTPQIWEHAVIIFTRANKADDYLGDLHERTKRIRDEIAKHTGVELANNIPSVAVDNKSETTPDGEKWLEELYTKVFVRISATGTLPFLMATAKKINGSQKKQIKKNQVRTNEETGSQNGKEHNWEFYGHANSGFNDFSNGCRQYQQKKNVKEQKTRHGNNYTISYDEYEEDSYSNGYDRGEEDNYSEQGFRFNDRQRAEIKNKLFSVVPVLKTIGGVVGTVLGGSSGKKIGEKIGGAVGHAVNFIGSLFG
ncbi:GTPase [Chroococcidiopsis sp. CCNUC1]|uniref:GTPase n=1 Tax=Chroococcidiopsis sp. CCNUC1 TaxID=2653189 RepID=UPI000D050F7C|nr:GTPase [Chroococcidiopsis sp. CCNUC1]PSB47517.1 hypothetical protein C7B80_09285 [Cyanosarcina cf. burmensis CCALA 770]URD50871.1 50S ribosome-binding GTPase [Chroococcidiopsis sp. CCNUC1]